MGCCDNKRNPPSFAKNAKPVMDPTPQHSVVSNVVKAVKTQSNPLRWFKDGVSGLLKCVTSDVSYSDEQIIANRAACGGCEYATRKNGEVFPMSQCMAPDPEKGGEVCGCFIMCKTQVGKCPLGRFTDLTINKT